MKAQLTVLIPCKNERRNLRPCVAAVRSIADEVLVADSGSSDGSQELARSLDCRVIEREQISFSDFKNWAIPQARYDWVLIVDADERVTPELAAEINRILAAPPPEIHAYWIYRDTFFLGRHLRWGDCRNDRVMRLLRRDACRYAKHRVHEELAVAPPQQGTLRGRLLHYSSWTYEQYLAKMVVYSRLSALDMYDRGRRAGFWGMLLRPPLRFFQMYVLRGGFLDGLPGLQMSILVAFNGFLKQARLWALCNPVLQPDPEAAPSSQAGPKPEGRHAA